MDSVFEKSEKSEKSNKSTPKRTDEQRINRVGIQIDTGVNKSVQNMIQELRTSKLNIRSTASNGISKTPRHSSLINESEINYIAENPSSLHIYSDLEQHLTDLPNPPSKNTLNSCISLILNVYLESINPEKYIESTKKSRYLIFHEMELEFKIFAEIQWTKEMYQMIFKCNRICHGSAYQNPDKLNHNHIRCTCTSEKISTDEEFAYISFEFKDEETKYFPFKLPEDTDEKKNSKFITPVLVILEMIKLDNFVKNLLESQRSERKHLFENCSKFIEDKECMSEIIIGIILLIDAFKVVTKNLRCREF